jgi:hypothetical protein
MKANELRIGNLVYLTDKEKVWEILDGHEIDECDDNLSVDPIPLTEEWLLKFGFIDLNERCGLNGIYAIIGKRGHINIETMSYCEIDYEGSVDDIVKIEYVHELQNLFYVLNKEELNYESNNRI